MLKILNAPTGEQHPLEPLTATEVVRAVDIVRRRADVTPQFRFVSVTLQEPGKSTKADDEHEARRAFVILLDNATGMGFEAIVDLAGAVVTSWHALGHGVQPAIMLDEFIECEEAVKRSPLFLDALKKRGASDVSLVMVDPWSAGAYGTEPQEDKGRRLSRALCWIRSEPNDNGYARPIDAIVAMVDLNRMEVLRIEDYGVAPLPPESNNWHRGYIPKTRGDLKPLEIVQPDGPSFTVSGHEINWQKWRFRISFTPREGLVLHTVTYNDEGRERSILHRASVCDMVVPYGDPGEAYYRKNAFDIGEYGVGTLANSLALGCDCLGHIHYFDAHLTDSHGKLFTLKNAVCLHEEDFGVLWKHTDWRTNQAEVRRSRRLVVSFFATVGNYEYGFFWNFYQDGSIQLEVKLTGIMNTCALQPGETPRYGEIIAPQVSAPYHQHIFNARLDVSIDGETNSVEEVNLNRLPRDKDNPHGNAFRAEATLLERELQARRGTSSATSRFWRIFNPSKLNRLGKPVGYRLIAGENAPAMVQPDAAVMKRAGFMAYPLWVTPYHPSERYAAGEYPNQNPASDGLPRWTQQDRVITNTDIVVWYTFGHSHVPRPEDWPVMPVHHIGFWLKPDGFFDRNPAMDLPPSPSKQSCCHT